MTKTELTCLVLGLDLGVYLTAFTMWLSGSFRPRAVFRPVGGKQPGHSRRAEVA